MNDRFKGKTAIVTGAGSGIGKAIAESLAEEGAQVVINDIDPQLIDIIRSRNNISGIPGDMASLKDINELIEFTVHTYGPVDLLVANAGITHFAPFLEFSEEEFDRVVNLNLKGTYFLTQSVVKNMRKKGGRIVLISSVVSKRGYFNLSVYSMTKAALNMMARCLSIELAPYGINVNAVAPGATVTERTLQELEDYRETWSELTPTGRPAEVKDIAHAVLFLLSDQGRQINGQTIVVDGGWSGMGVNPG